MAENHQECCEKQAAQAEFNHKQQNDPSCILILWSRYCEQRPAANTGWQASSVATGEIPGADGSPLTRLGFRAAGELCLLEVKACQPATASTIQREHSGTQLQDKTIWDALTKQ